MDLSWGGMWARARRAGSARISRGWDGLRWFGAGVRSLARVPRPIESSIPPPSRRCGRRAAAAVRAWLCGRRRGQLRLGARVAHTAGEGPTLQPRPLAAACVAAEGATGSAVVPPREEAETGPADRARDRQVRRRPLGGGGGGGGGVSRGEHAAVERSPPAMRLLARCGEGAVRACIVEGGAVVLRAQAERTEQLDRGVERGEAVAQLTEQDAPVVDEGRKEAQLGRDARELQ